MAIALYGLSADPPTLGHQWVIDYGAKTYEQLYVALATNPNKSYTFPVNLRKRMLEGIACNYHNVKIIEIHNEFLVHVAKKAGATILLRGIRNNADYDYERMMESFNAWLEPGIRTVYVGPPHDLPNIVSSSFVKGLVGLEGWKPIVAKLVPDHVLAFLNLMTPTGIKLP